MAAFNNSGYSLFENSLASPVDDSISIAILSALVFLGGLGFHITA
ncbi:MAG: hypothetical protein DIU65_16170, partial [Proteobacteria bacterium]